MTGQNDKPQEFKAIHEFWWGPPAVVHERFEFMGIDGRTFSRLHLFALSADATLVIGADKGKKMEAKI